MSERQEKVEGQDPNPRAGYVEPAPLQLAEGTRRDIDLQPRKGICVATRCQTVEQFIATFHRCCEDSAIFIFNARWPVGTILPFSFELANEESVLVGVGKVVEEFTTAQNRFGRAGLVIAVQKLKRESVAVFKRLLVARNTAEVDRDTPPPVFARATPAPSALEEARRQLRPTRPLEVRIPSPSERPTATARAKTVLGIPTIAKLPSKHPVMQIPAITPRVDAKGSRPVRVPEATPRPVIQARDTAADGVPDAIEGAIHDTVRDEIPFALRNELRLLESASVARPVDLDVDVGWDVEDPVPAAHLIALPTPETIVEPTPEAIVEPAPEAILETAPEAVPEPVAADDAVEAIVAQDAVPDRVTADETIERTFAAVTAPEDTATRDDVDELPIASSWWRSSLRWAARVAIASALFVTAAAITASIDAPSLPVATESEATAAFATIPSESSQAPTPPADSAQAEQETVPEPQPQPAAAGQQPAVASEKKPARSLAATRPGRPLVSKARCASLDCL